MSKKLNVSPQEQVRWKEIGTLIRLMRQARRPLMSMAQLGQRIGRSKGLIGQIERGEVNPRIHLDELANALGCHAINFLPSVPSKRLRKLPKRLDQATPQQHDANTELQFLCRQLRDNTLRLRDANGNAALQAELLIERDELRNRLDIILGIPPLHESRAKRVQEQSEILSAMLRNINP